MTNSKSILTTAATAVLALCGAGVARAVDVTPAPKGGLVVVGPGGVCTTCEAAPCSAPADCASCGHGHGGHLLGGGLLHGRHQPYTVNLCPGACFGYFQTQWRRWEEVCPYPYQGV